MKTQKSPFFKKYEVLDALGEGGFGRVVKARHQILGQVFAIKQLAPGLVASEEDYERFVREAQAMAQLEHPHIVSIYDADVESGFPYLVMEFVEGRDVDRIVTEDGPCAVAEAVRLGREIASALAHMHAHGIVHRDVKTSNILRREADGHYFLTDFGLALQSDLSRITTAVMGSRAYMSPEQIDGQAVPASDQYSLGVVLFEVLTGRPPFVLEGEHGAALVQFVQQVHHAPPPSMTRFRLDVPEWLDDVVARCLRKDPADRFPDMQALEQALTAGSAGTDATSEEHAHGAAPPPAGPAEALPAADRAAAPVSEAAPAKPATARWGRWLALGLAVLLAGALLVHVAGRPGGGEAPPGEAVAGGAAGV
ncbi:MAG: serine/threonine-protein kinase, partial [Rhodothermales bacterium]|nr:serine/threonine-protein kinase [Rhodothermales bacterium]